LVLSKFKMDIKPLKKEQAHNTIPCIPAPHRPTHMYHSRSCVVFRSGKAGEAYVICTRYVEY